MIKNLFEEGLERRRQLLRRQMLEGSVEGGEKTLTEHRVEVRSINSDEKSVVYVITSSAIDRYGEVMDPKGLELEQFRKTKRTVFWNHDYNRIVGRSLWEKLEGEQWLAKVQFAAETTAFGEDIWNLAREGYIGMTSIGFIPKAFETMKLAELKDLHPSNRDEFDPRTDIWVWRKAELLEFSLVGVGANPDAVEYEKILRSGLIQSGELRREVEEGLREQRVCELEACRGTMEELPERIAKIEKRLTLYDSREEEMMHEEKTSNQSPTGVSKEQLEKLIAETVQGTLARLKGHVQ